MDPVHILMDLVHGPGPWKGSMDQGSMFCTFPRVHYMKNLDITNVRGNDQNVCYIKVIVND